MEKCPGEIGMKRVIRSLNNRAIRRLICILITLVMASGLAVPVSTDALSLDGRQIAFSKIVNARDLGGYRTKDGRVVRKGILIRSGELSYASASDIRKLRNKYHIRTVIDLRYPTDFKYCKDKRISGAKYVNISARKNAHPSKSAAKKRYRKLRKKSKTRLIKAAAGSFNKVSSSYTNALVNSSYSKKKYRKFFNKLLENKDGNGVLFHCVCGKDRTGVAAFMTLVALGVDEETAYREYSLTNSYLKKYVPKKYKKGGIGVREKDLRAAVSRAKKKYGSMSRFLEKAYGLDAKKIAKLRKIYTEEITDN